MKQKLHPELEKVRDVWEQIRILKEADRGLYSEFMLTLPNESIAARQERVTPFRVGFINTTNMLLRSKGDAVFKKSIQRTGLGDGQEAFVAKADKSGQALQEMVQNEVAPSLAAYGTVFAVLDKPAAVSGDKATELAEGLPFLTVLSPQQVIDFAYDVDGALLWFMYWVDSPVNRTDPFKPAKAWKTDKGVAVWTRTDFAIYAPGGKAKYQESVAHTFGFVPVVIQAQYVEPGKTIGQSTFFATSDYLVTANNLNCASNMEVYKNSSATLLMPIADYSEDEGQPKHEKNPDTNLKRLHKQADDIKNVLLYTDKDAKPEYLARNLDLIDKASARAQKYLDLAVDNEKHALSVNSLKAPQSGVSKAYDFDDIHSMLASFAAALQRFETQAIGMAGKMLGEATEFAVVYPRDFDVRDFNARLEFIKGLRAVAYPSALGMREAYKTLTPEIAQDEKLAQQIDGEIDKAKPAPEPPVENPKPPLEGEKKEEENGTP